MKNKIFYCFLLSVVAAYFVTDIIVPNKTAQIFMVKGYQVVTDSMSGLYEVGDIVFVTGINSKNIKIGDAITFEVNGIFVTHRVAVILTDTGNISFKTQANKDFINKTNRLDSWTVCSADIIGKVFFVIPKPMLICDAILIGIISNVFIICYIINVLFPKEPVNNYMRID